MSFDNRFNDEPMTILTKLWWQRVDRYFCRTVRIIGCILINGCWYYVYLTYNATHYLSAVSVFGFSLFLFLPFPLSFWVVVRGSL